MALCSCGSRLAYASCCELYILNKKTAQTPEALMRSRFTAYTLGDIAYIEQTMQGEALVGFQAQEVARWAARVSWIDLKVLYTEIIHADVGWVEFEARFVDGSRLQSIHEKSRFIRDKGRWFYVSGVHLPASCPEKPILRHTSCPCGSLRKFKNCHGHHA